MAPTQGAILLRQIRKLLLAQCPSRQSDLQLLQQFVADRDEVAFTALVQRHGTMVLGVCRGVLHHQQDAEDVFQAAFLVLARKAPAIRKQQSVSSWLHGVAYRLALKAKARAKRRQGCDLPNEELLAATMDDLSLRELRVILHEELQRLPDKYRAPLLLCYWEGKTRDEAAAQIGLTAGAFKKHLERARNLLRSRLIRRGLVPSAAFFATLFSDMGAKAAVSSVLTNTTVKAAVAFAAGKGATAGAPGALAAALAEGAIRAMNTTNWATKILVIIFLGGLGTGLGLVTYQALLGRQPDAPTKAVAARGLPQVLGQEKTAAGQKPDKERILGTWRITKGQVDSKDLPPEFHALARLRFTKDGKAIMSVANESNAGKYQLIGPGKIDLTLNAENANKDLSPGIYKFEGDDRLTVCAMKERAGTERPTEFSGEKNSGQVLFVLARAKPGEEKLTPQEIAKFQGGIDKVRANNLKQIALAMHRYHDAHKALPLHAIYSKDGKTPLLSWRVAILPYLEQQALFQEFKLDEAWDSPHNKKLIAKMPMFYQVKIGQKGEGLTYYQVFTGPDTLFDGTKKMNFTDITDGLSNTLLALEAKDPVPWTKPADLTLPKDKDKMPAVGGLFKNGLNILLCDGSVRFLPLNPAPTLLRALVTPRGGEQIAP